MKKAYAVYREYMTYVVRPPYRCDDLDDIYDELKSDLMGVFSTEELADEAIKSFSEDDDELVFSKREIEIIESKEELEHANYDYKD